MEAVFVGGQRPSLEIGGGHANREAERVLVAIESFWNKRKRGHSSNQATTELKERAQVIGKLQTNTSNSDVVASL